MSSDDNQKSEEFGSEIDNAVESFFSRYEENAPKMDDISLEAESDSEENALETDDSSLEPVFELLSEAENAPDTDDATDEPEPDAVSEGEEITPEEDISDSDHSPKKKFDPTDTFVFRSLTEAVLTVDWEVNDANVKKAREILEKIQRDFPILKETRAQDVIDGMLATLDTIAESPRSVSTSATAQLEKAIPILRGIAAGAEMEDGYDDLIEDAIAGLEACRKVVDSVESGVADSPDLEADDGIPFDNETDLTSFDDSAGETPKAEKLEPLSVPAGISHALSHHSKVLAQLTPRAKRLADQYAAAKGSEKVQELIQKICGLLELQTRALQDIFSLNCAIAVFPMGKIENLSDFIGFQLKSMGVSLKYARAIENVYKKQPHRRRFQQSIYLLRIAIERQIDELSRAAGVGDAPAREALPTVPAALSAILREHLQAMEECMERAGFVAECEEGCDHKQINEAGRSLREKIAGQIDILRSALN